MKQGSDNQALDAALQELPQIAVPDGLTDRILAGAPERVHPWVRFARPVLAGPALALSMLMGALVGYGAPSLAANNDFADDVGETFELAFDAGFDIDGLEAGEREE